MRAWLAATGAVILSSCSADPGIERLYRFDENVVIVARISGAGGALGNETYRVSYRHDGEETRFFEGVNPRAFAVSKEGNTVAIRFCDGSVSLAQPIFIGPPENRLIPLDLQLACPEHEKALMERKIK